MSKLALVDALRAPTHELRAQHRYKTLVVDYFLDHNTASTTNITKVQTNNNSSLLLFHDENHGDDKGGSNIAPQKRSNTRSRHEDGRSSGNSSGAGGLRGPGILTPGAERGRDLRDTRWGNVCPRRVT